MREIRLYPDPVLRKKAAPLTERDKIREVVQELKTAFENNDAVGLAAPQIGLLYRAIIVMLKDDIHVVINPKIVWRSLREETGVEACLSLPGVAGYVDRPVKITATGWDENGNAIGLELEGYDARIFLHEVDHLDGILYIDHLPEIDRKAILSEYELRRRYELDSSGEST